MYISTYPAIIIKTIIHKTSIETNNNQYKINVFCLKYFSSSKYKLQFSYIKYNILGLKVKI